MYKIVITQSVDNPKFEEDYQEWKKQSQYGRSMDCPNKYYDIKQLEMSLKDEEFEAIRKACLEKM